MPALLFPTLPPAVPEEPVVRLSVPQYHAMIEAGILASDDRLELIEGWLVPKMSPNPPHAVVTGLLVDLLPALLPPGWHLREQKPITLTDSEPEPDVVIARGGRRDYGGRHPGPADASLVIEVTDTTLARDRGSKVRTYGRAGIVTYWIVNLADRQVEVYTDPTGAVEPAGYRQRQDYLPGSTVPVVLDGVVVGQLDVNSVLP